MPTLDQTEKLLRIVRDIVLLAVLCGVVFVLGPQIPRLAKQLENSTVSEVNLGVIKLKVDEAANALEKTLQKASSQSGPEDTRVPDELKPVAEALASLRDASSSVAAATSQPTRAATQPASFWVYLGARKDGAWLTSSYEIREVPADGAIIRPTLDVFGRRRAPAFMNGAWTKGETVGVLKAGQTAKVLRTEKVPGTGGRELWWAEVVPQ